MDNIENIFKNENRTKTLRDYNQFQTKILTGVRGTSKTFETQEIILNKVLNGKFFALLRESQIELDLALQGGFWDNNLISKEKYNKHSYSVKGNRILVDDKVVGVGIALTTYGNFRGIALNLGNAIKTKKERERQKKRDLEEELEIAEKLVENNIDKLEIIFFDEFEPIEPKLSNEKRYLAYLHICETLFRFRENVQVIMCANIESPYSVFLDELNFPKTKKIEYGIKKSYYKNEKGKLKPLAIWCHLEPNEKWKTARANSYVGKIQSGKDLGMFTTGLAYKGMDFISIPRNEPHYLLFNLYDGINNLSFWRCKNDKDIFHVTERSNSTTYATFCFNIEHAVLGVQLINPKTKEVIKKSFSNDCIKFESAKVFSIFINMIK